MSEKNKTIELNDDQNEKVAVGRTPGARSRVESDKACNSFICIQCGGTASQHKTDGNGLGSDSIFTNKNGYWQEEWTHYQLDCNHCKYFNHISWAYGECVKDCK